MEHQSESGFQREKKTFNSRRTWILSGVWFDSELDPDRPLRKSSPDFGGEKVKRRSKCIGFGHQKGFKNLKQIGVIG